MPITHDLGSPNSTQVLTGIAIKYNSEGDVGTRAANYGDYF